MRLRAQVSESLRNLWSRPLQSIFIAVVSASLAFTVFLLPWLNLTYANALLEQDVLDGRTIIVIGNSTGTIPTGLCDSLNSVQGVRSAGAVIAGVDAETPGGRRLSAVLVTPGLISVQWPELAAPETRGVVLPASESQLALGQVDLVIDSSRASVEIVGKARAPGRLNNLASMLMIPSSQVGASTECYVESAPGSESGVGDVVASRFPANAGYRVVPFLAGPRAGANSEVLIDSSPVRWLPIAAAAVVVVLTASLAWSRRYDLAVYQQLGLPRTGVAVMSLVEWFAVVLLPASAGTFAAILLAAQGDVTSTAAVSAASATLQFVLGSILAPLAAGIVALGLGRASAGKL
jgi:hypothetical protein